MTGVPALPSFNIADANGVTTVFNFTFFAYDNTYVKVYSVLNDVLTPITTGITIAVNSSFLGGTVTFSAAPLDAVGSILVRRELPYTQETEFADLTRYKETAIETAMNTLALQIQQLKSFVDLSMKYVEGSGATNPVVGTPEDGKALVFDGTTGKLIAGPDAADIAAAQGNAATAAAAATAAEVAEDNAAASAAAAAAAANSAIWSNVVFLTSASSPYTVTSANSGDLLSVDTSGGAVIINLPSIAAQTLPFNIGVKKTTSDANTVTVNRNGTDTIGAAGTSKVFDTQDQGGTFVADTDTAPDQWAVGDFGPSAPPTGSVVYTSLAAAIIGSVADMLAGTASKILNAANFKSFVDTYLIRKEYGTSQATTSGTSKTWAAPAGCNRFTVMFDNVTTNGSGHVGVRLGTASTPQTSGYLGTSVEAGGVNSVYAPTDQAGVIKASSGRVLNGAYTFTKMTGDKWTGSHALGFSSASNVAAFGGFTVGLSGALDIVEVRSGNGSDAFTAGSINILFEV